MPPSASRALPRTLRPLARWAAWGGRGADSSEPPQANGPTPLARIRGRNCDHSEMRTHSDFTATERGHNGSMGGLGRMLMALGVVLIVVGVLVTFGERLPVRLGRLPGDIVWRGKNSVFYFPLMTSIL